MIAASTKALRRTCFLALALSAFHVDGLAQNALSSNLNGPLVAVGRTAHTPQMKGDIADPTWQPAVSIKDFVLFGTFQPATEATQVRFAYDQKNLYAQIRMEESLLVAATQRTHEIQAKAVKRDEDVLSDDSISLILRPPSGESAYEFSINTLNTIADAKLNKDDLWESRDEKWNAPGIQSAVRLADGFWILEMTIPWSELGAVCPTIGEQWQVIVTRQGRARDEVSSWNRTMISGTHLPAEWASLVFTETVPAVTPSPVRSLEKKNQLSLDIVNPVGQLHQYFLSASVTDSSRVDEERSKIDAAGKTGTVVFNADSSGPVDFQWALRKASNLDVIYRSPMIRMEVQAANATLYLTTDKAYKVAVNGDIISEGQSATDKAISLSLKKGANLIAIEAQSGSINAKMDSLPGALDENWLVQPANTTGGLFPNSDDPIWQRAVSDNRGGFRLDSRNKAAVFRHEILHEYTRIWPTPSPALFLTAGAANEVFFTVGGIPNLPLKDWTLWLALPDGIKVTGASGFYGHRNGKARFELAEKGKIQLNGEEHSLYSVKADQTLVFNPEDPPILNILSVLFNPDISHASTNRQNLTFWSEANDGSVSEPPKSVAIEHLEELRGEQPKHLVWQLWYLAEMDSQECARQVLSMAQKAGINEIICSEQSIAELGAELGIRGNRLVSFRPWSIDLGPHLKAHPDERLLDANGVPNPHLLCTTLLVGKGWDTAGPIMAADLQRHRVPVTQYDFEFPPFDGEHACYCERCLGEFRSHAKISPSENLSSERIRKDFGPQWIDFMCLRGAQICRRMKETTHQTNPDGLFFIYSGYQSPETAFHYGMNWDYIRELQAADYVGCGYGRPVEAISATKVALPGTPVLFGELLMPYLTKESFRKISPVPQLSKAHLLRRSLDSTGGVLIYERWPMDGRSWEAIGDVTRLVTKYETLFLKGERLALPDQDSVAVTLLKGEQQSLLCLMNTGNEARQFHIPLPASLKEGQSFYDEENTKINDLCKMTLPPNEIAVYVFPPQ